MKLLVINGPNLNMLGIPTCWQTFAVGLVLLSVMLPLMGVMSSIG